MGSGCVGGLPTYYDAHLIVIGWRNNYLLLKLIRQRKSCDIPQPAGYIWIG